MRWRAVAERFEQEAEALLRLGVADAEGAEHLRLHLRAVDADRAAAELQPVEHHVIRARQHRAGIALHLVDVLEPRRRERMVPREVALRLFIPFEEREVDDPHKLPRLRRDELLLARDAQAQLAE